MLEYVGVSGRVLVYPFCILSEVGVMNAVHVHVAQVPEKRTSCGVPSGRFEVVALLGL